MKRIKETVALSVLAFSCLAIAPKAVASTAYYSSITNTTDGSTLANQLYSAIDTSTNVGYKGLWAAYATTDVYPGTNIIWDLYSEYEYEAQGSKQGASYKAEGDSYNREHCIPQSWFSEASPMVADIHHVFPTDGYVNNRRSNYVFGEVGSATYTSESGYKLGTSGLSGYSGTVFEPIDRYKGDIARAYMYMAIRYKDKLSGWTSGEAQKIFQSSYPYLTTYAMDLFTKWSHEDPVSLKEKIRNDNAYTLQKNRNPFVDHPEYIDVIWSNSYSSVTEAYDSSAVSTAISKINSASSNTDAASHYYYVLSNKEMAAVTNTATLKSALGSDFVDYTTYTANVDLTDGTGSSGSGSGGSSSGGSSSGDSGSSSSTDTQTDGTTACYTISSTSAVTTSGTAPSKSSASYSSTYTSKCQLTAGNSMTLTLTGYDDQCIKGIKLSMKSNSSSGAGYLSATAGSTTIASIGSSASGVAFSDSKWNGSYTTTYTTISPTVSEYTVGTKESITITIGATTNSLYCESISVVYEDASAAHKKFETIATQGSMKFSYSTETVVDNQAVTYQLVTDASALEAGDSIIIAAKDSDYALNTTQNTNNRGASAISKSNSVLTPASDTLVLTLTEGSTSGTFGLSTGSGYLYAASSSKNYLKTENTLDSNGSWTITISDGTASIIAQGDYTHNVMQYNANDGSPIFACYSSAGQSALVIYKKYTGQTTTVNYTYSNTAIRFGTAIDKTLYDALVAEGTDVSFGVALSKDGTSYKDYECTPVSVNDNAQMQWAVVISTSASHYGDLVYAKCYVEIDGVKYYMTVKSYSVNTLAKYYYDNAETLGLTAEMFKGLEG